MKNIFLLYALLLTFFDTSAQTQQPNTSKTIIEGEILDGRSDTLTLHFYIVKLGQIPNGGSKILKTIANNGKFHFELPALKDPYYIKLYSSVWPRFYMDNYLVETGDSVHIKVDPANISKSKHINYSGIKFSGTNIIKYQMKFITDSITNEICSPLPKNIVTRKEIENDIDNLFNWFSITPYNLAKKINLEILDQNKKQITPLIYDIMKSDILYTKLAGELANLSLEWRGCFEYADSLNRKIKMVNFYNEHLKSEKELSTISEKARYLSMMYIDFLVKKTIFSTKIKYSSMRLDDARSLYPALSEITPPFKEKIITTTIPYISKGGLKGFDDYLQYALNQVKDEQLSSILHDYEASAIKGSMAYNFSLPDKNGKLITMEDLKGKTVLIDFWFTGCKPCESVAAKLRKVEESFKNTKDVVFVSISIDIKKQGWLSTLEKGSYTSSENINLYTEGLAQDHPVIRFYHINGYPKLILVGPDGKIYSANPPRPDGINGVEELCTLIKEAQLNK